ncbi:MAG: isoprenylcysteine carboxylmethyltransferase family protein [Proteobacteria bacterium]|nr:isoprenylcysteine carboxylmethyltransferase family protein [Pseudomonadota bacterium]
MSRHNKPNLHARAWVSLVVRMAAFPVVFLWPAGTWRWWEAWTLIGLWVAYAIAVTAFLARHDPTLLAERMKASPMQKGQKTWDKVIMLLMFTAGIGIFIVPGFDVVRFGWSEPLPVWVRILALLVHVPGFAFISWVMRENTYLSRVVKIDDERGHQVITTGPYALVRHPMYSAVIIMLLATPLALGSRFGLIPAALMVALLVVRTYFEDRTLNAELPGYPEYAKKTRYRLITGIW